MQKASSCNSNHVKNIFLECKHRNNLGNQKLIKGGILTIHLAHLPSGKDHSDCVLELQYAKCVTDLTGCTIGVGFGFFLIFIYLFFSPVEVRMQI